MKKELRILIVEDVVPDAMLINHELRKAGLSFRSRRVDSREAFLHELEHHKPDIILSDHGAPDFDGFAALEEARSRCPNVPFIFVTGAASEPMATSEPGGRADGCIHKNRLQLLAPAIQRAVTEARERSQYRQMQTAFELSEQRLRAVTEEMRDCAVVMLDAEARVLSWNPGAERAFGRRSAETLGQDFETMLAESRHDTGVIEEALAVAARGARFEGSVQLQQDDDVYLRAKLVVVPLRDEANQLRGSVWVVKNLPDPANNALRARSAKLEAARREFEEFTHSIALDLRIPLHHMDGFVEMLIKTSGDRLDQKGRDYLKTISDSARQMGKLIDELFTFSRIGQTRMHHLRFSLGDTLREVLHDFRLETEGRDIVWNIGALPEIEGDPVLFWLVLTNLVSNALKFTRPRATARIAVQSRETEREHIVYMRDNGVGFDMRSADRLFCALQRAHNGNQFEGMGVGLANVRRIVERHRGRVWAEGALDAGATFYFAVPRPHGERSQVQSSKLSAADVSGAAEPWRFA
jgi:PAS domain S-box-containing protein